VATSSGTLDYTENDPAKPIDDGVTVADVDDANLAGATVTITNPQDGDRLAYATTSGVAGSVDAAGDTVTLTGAHTKADYQAALRAITYESTSEDPATEQRTVTVTVTDGHLTSTAAQRKIGVTATDEPVQTPPPTTTTTATTTTTPTTTTPTTTTPTTTTPSGPGPNPAPKTAGAGAVTGGTVEVPMTCDSPTPCTGAVELDTSGASAAKKGRPRTVKLGKAGYTIPSGTTAKVKIHLNAAGKKALRKHRGRLRVSATVTPAGGQPTKSSLTLKQTKPKRP
jgi:hypothetical protein